jgi:ATP-binding cassette, subfamily B (MDR/TAP), member 1
MFGTSILENILYGLADHGLEKMSYGEKKDKVIEACKVANAHEFIMKLPKVCFRLQHGRNVCVHAK